MFVRQPDRRVLVPAQKLVRLLQRATLAGAFIVLTPLLPPAADALAKNTPLLTVSPSPTAAGWTAEVNAPALGGLEKVVFGLDDNAASTFPGGGTSVTVDVEESVACTSLIAGNAETFGIDISDSESSLAQATITATALPASSNTPPAAPPTSSRTQEPAPIAISFSPAAPIPFPLGDADGEGLGRPWAVVIIAALAAGAFVATLVLVRRRRTTDPTMAQAPPDDLVRSDKSGAEKPR